MIGASLLCIRIWIPKSNIPYITVYIPVWSNSDSYDTDADDDQ